MTVEVLGLSVYRYFRMQKKQIGSYKLSIQI